MLDSSQAGARRRVVRDSLQVNLRWVVSLVLLLVIVPTVLLTGFAIFLLRSHEQSRGLLLGILIASFSASVVAGATLLLFLARRGARLAQMQETFLSRMGHELLTPLAGIRLHTQILAGTRVPPDVQTSLEAIRKETDRLQTLVERIVSWRRFRSSRHLYRRAPTTAQQLVDEVLKRVPGSGAVRVRVSNPGMTVTGDAEALAEAIGNLLQNALKYAGADGPVELATRRLGRMAVFAVADSGPGLPPGPPEQLFDPFFRYVAPDRPDPGGSGLGLSITRQIVRAHGGKLAIHRRRRGGLSFFFVLPATSPP